jgi:WD40 repeat protein
LEWSVNVETFAAYELSSDGHTVLEVKSDAVRLWNVSDGSEIVAIKESLHTVEAYLSGDNRTILWVGPNEARVFDVETGPALRTLANEHGFRISAAALSEDVGFGRVPGRWGGQTSEPCRFGRREPPPSTCRR